MNHSILTETEFFRMLKERDSTHGQIHKAYNDFITRVTDLCTGGSNPCHAFSAMTYTEIELQYHEISKDSKSDMHAIYVCKAAAFIHRMLEHLSTRLSSQVFDETDGSGPEAPPSPLRWSGNAVDLVEMIYGIHEMGCINEGGMSLKDLSSALYTIFKVESKDCYRFYTDIKRRKSDSRTYFIDRMQEKLNEKMRRDDELERMRR